MYHKLKLNNGEKRVVYGTLKSNTKDTDMNKINMNTGNKGEKVTIWFGTNQCSIIKYQTEVKEENITYVNL